MYNWQITSYSDPDLQFDYQLESLAQKIYFLQKTWLWEQKNPRILVTGAANWLAHYLLHVLTENIDIGEILAIDVGSRPDYLAARRYQEIRYIALQRRFKDLAEIVATFRPQLIFHADYIWNINRRNLSFLYERNVCQTEVLCDSAIAADVRRIVLFSDATIYGPGKEIASEETPPAPVLPLARSFLEVEQLAAEFHCPEKTAIYILRCAPLYGPMIPVGMMLLARLIADGILLGPPQTEQQQITAVSGRDLALAAFLIAMAPDPGYQTFNIAANPIGLDELFSRMAQYLPRQKVLGMTTRLAGIMKIGYQQEIRLPDNLLKFIGRFAEQSNNFFNQLRFEKRMPVLTPELIDYLLALRGLSNKRLRDSLGWQPEFSDDFLQATIEYAGKQGWHIKQHYPRQDLSEMVPVLDGVTAMTEALFAYSPESDDPATTYRVPLLNFDIDIKSLRILVERAWNYFWLSVIKGERPDTFGEALPQFFSSAGESILTLVRYEHSRARRLYPDSSQQQLKWLTKQIGSLDRKKLRFYVTVIVLNEIISKAYKRLQSYEALIQLLPDKNYGVFLASEIGDIGIVFKVKQGQLTVNFPRKQVEAISRSLYLPRRLSEFQKATRLHIALGVRLERFLSDLMAGTVIKGFVQQFGQEYLLSDSTKHYEMIGRAVRKSNINIYLFLNQSYRVAFGIRIAGKIIEMVAPDYIEMVNLLIEETNDYGEAIQMISKASAGKEEAAFFRIRTVRKLLGGMIAPSRLRKLLIKLLERAAGLS